MIVLSLETVVPVPTFTPPVADMTIGPPVKLKVCPAPKLIEPPVGDDESNTYEPPAVEKFTVPDPPVILRPRDCTLGSDVQKQNTVGPVACTVA